ncbi:MAG TPA: hypothetical protein VG714_07775, partial [Acidobacteriaceae bacterium]|nr:hypothetical protein [Acidobacteriaceae bacterium]
SCLRARVHACRKRRAARRIRSAEGRSGCADAATRDSATLNPTLLTLLLSSRTILRTHAVSNSERQNVRT